MSAIDRRSQGGRAVLVLGASGFVGGHVCRAFTEAGWRVAGVARTAVDRTARGTATSYEIHELDLVRARPDRLMELVRRHRADVVVNAAGAVWGVTEAEMDLGNRDLVRRLVAAGPPRLIQLGSVHEYGPVPRTAITETTPTAPVTPYGRSKLAGARALLDSGTDGLVLRVSNVAGPGTSPVSLLGMVAAHLASGPAEPLRLAPLLAHRDFVDVRDVADAVVAAAASEVTGRVVNIGGGQATSVRDLVGRLVAADGRGARIVEAPVRGGRPPEAEWQRMDITLAGTLLGWRPRRSLDESLRDLLSSAVRAAAPTMSASAHS
ncbi:NAD-dependent epimerase/dehydratase family protein [Streptomyces sp. NPDC093261]|uniref:NAD-dependent epimerase/dehydratase family protein n=1 Tax=Streptomyces sp. NPDC093261 TaxID=3366037 RepID=UPI003812D09A